MNPIEKVDLLSAHLPVESNGESKEQEAEVARQNDDPRPGAVSVAAAAAAAAATNNTSVRTRSGYTRGLRRSSQELEAKRIARGASALKKNNAPGRVPSARLSAPIVKGGLHRNTNRTPLETERLYSDPIVKGGLHRNNRPSQAETRRYSGPIVKGGLRRQGRPRHAPLPDQLTDLQQQQATTSRQVSDQEVSVEDEVVAGELDFLPSTIEREESSIISRQSSSALPVIDDNVYQGEPHNDPDDGLVEARLVRGDSMSGLVLPEAESVDLEAAERRKVLRDQRKRRIYATYLGVFILLVTITIVLSIVLSGKGTTTSSSISNRTNDTSTGLPTNAPTSMPTTIRSAVLKSFRKTLPNFTIGSLLDPTSPQALAWGWLENHPSLVEHSNWRLQQLFALACFYYSFEGATWPNGLHEDWLDYKRSECEWFSTEFGSFNTGWQSFAEFTAPGAGAGDNSYIPVATIFSPCNEDTGSFEHLILDEALLFKGSQSPSFPPELILLPNLTTISVSSNRINASLGDLIPEALIRLTSLRRLQLGWNNDIHGTIPPYIFHGWPNIFVVQLQDNTIGGTIPPEMSLSQVRLLSLDNNRLEGTLPSQIGLMTDLLSLDLNGNTGLSGTLPTEIGEMTKLFWLELQECAFSGKIPSELGALSNMIHLELQQNNWSSPLPSEIFGLTKLEVFSLDSDLLPNIPYDLLDNLPNLEEFVVIVDEEVALNQSTSVFPMDIFERAEFITSLDLSGRGLRGTIPSEIGLLTNCEGLMLTANSFSGAIPSELGLMTSLRSLDLRNNSLTGLIPSEIGEAVVGPVDLLTLFYNEILLTDNMLSGGLPTELGHCTGLFLLEVSQNLLSSTVPSELGILSSLAAFYMDFNYMTGQLPDELGLLGIRNLLARQNLLSGTIPTTLNMPGLDLSSNLLSGTIPTEYLSRADIAYLELSDNSLTGNLPSELGLLSGIPGFPFVRIFLDNNMLRGPVPQELVAMTNYLVEMDITGNSLLSGTVPEELCFLQDDSCTYSYQDTGIRECDLSFDCTGILCGCHSNCTCG